MAGFFEMVPRSWLQDYIRFLPEETRLALFRTSRWLARLVVQNASKVKLKLADEVRGSSLGHSQEDQVSWVTRRMVLALLDEDRDFTLHLRLGSLAPYPVTLCSRVTTLRLHGSRSHAPTPFSWARFPNLRTLKFDEVADRHALCEAIKEGQLPHLCNLSAHTHFLSLPGTGKLMDVIGPQITNLTCYPRFWEHVQLSQFPELQSLQLKYCELTTESVQGICTHPSLRSLSLSAVHANQPLVIPRLLRMWEVLEVKNTPWAVVAAFPLLSVQQVVVRGVTDHGAHDNDAMADVLALHASQIMCKPTHHDAFVIEGFSACTTQILKHLHPTCRTLCLIGCPPDAHVLSALWAALPSFVHTICFECMHGVDWANFWESFPASVANVEFRNVYGPESPALFEELCSTAPPYVQSLSTSHYSWMREL